MTRKQNRALWLRPKQEERSDRSLWTPVLCGAFLYALGLLLGDPTPWLPAAAGTLVCAAYLLTRKRGWFAPAVLCAMVLLTLLFRDAITDGFARFYNRMGDAYTMGTGIVLPALETGGEGHVLFSVLVGVGVGLVFCLLSGGPACIGLTALLCAGASILMNREIFLLPLVLCAVLLCVPRRGRGMAMVIPLVVLILLSRLPGVQSWSIQQSELLRSAVHEARYETAYTTLPEGDISRAELPKTDAAALVVTMEKPETLYLRGFTGAVLEGEQWKPLDTQVLAKQEDLLYWLNLNEFDIRAQFDAAAPEAEYNTVTVQNLGACSSYRYIPFGIRADEKLSPEDLADHAKGNGERYDLITTVHNAPALIPQLLENLAGSDDPEVLRYLQAEAAYRGFVREHYLTVPAGTALEEYWNAAEGMEPQAAVKAVLERCWPEGARTGPHYATAAVLTLRHFGIPARYAEGYIVPETGEPSIEVTGAHAACWAEVYQDGIGWLPMALTPGLEQTVQEETVEKETPPETIPQETQPQSDPEPTGGTQVRIDQLLLSGMLIVLLLILLAVLLLVLRRRWIINKRKALLEQGEVREAVAWSMADAVSMLARLNIHRGNGSLDCLVQPIRERFGEEYAQRFQAAAGLNAKALFSSREMGEADRGTMLDLRARTLELLKAEANWIKKLWMQFILCLY